MAGLTPDKAQSFLGDVAADKLFVTNDGLALGNLDQLAKALKAMSATTYDHHATPDRNDFCNWVEHVIGDSGLASRLREATHPKQAAGLVAARVRQLQKALVPGQKKAAPEPKKPEQMPEAKKAAKKIRKRAAGKAVEKAVEKAVPKAKEPQAKAGNKAAKKIVPKAKKPVPKPKAEKVEKKTPKVVVKKAAKPARPASAMLLKKPKAKAAARAATRRKAPMPKMKKLKQLSKEDVDKIEQHTYLKVKYPHHKMYEQSIIQKHEHINYKLKEFLYGFIVGFVAALILLRMLRII